MSVVLDSIEDGDIVEYGGDNGSFSIDTSVVHDGSNSISCSTGDVAITRTDKSISHDDTPFGGWMATNNGSEPGFVWGVGSEVGYSSLAGYAVILSDYSGEVQLVRYDSDGSQTQLSSKSVDWSWETYYEVACTQWTSGGDITVEIRDGSGNIVSTLTAIDDTHGPGGFGWLKSNQYNYYKSYYDYAYKTPPLTAPENVRISDSSVEDELTVSWDAGIGASEYHVYRSESTGTTTSDYTQIATITDDGSTSYSHTDTNLEDGERYYYRVSSVN